MTEVISVKFKADGCPYYFDPCGEKYTLGTKLIVETAGGLELGTVCEVNKQVEDTEVVAPLKKVIRVATQDDLKKADENKEKAKHAFAVCEQKIAHHGLDMKLIEAQYSFDGTKVFFFFTSDGRVDFRELVRDLGSTLHLRIELRQIGVRDEARMLGGISICGQPYCCSRFLNGFQPVSIKMAKEQGLSLNPTKISGSCGRLMCCLKYEQEAYEYLISKTPSIGSTVKTPDGVGVVVDENLISGTLYIKLEEAEIPMKVNRKDVTVISGGKGRKPKKPIEN